MGFVGLRRSGPVIRKIVNILAQLKREAKIDHSHIWGRFEDHGTKLETS